MVILQSASDAVREARHANRRAVRHAMANGVNDVSGMLYRNHEFRQRDFCLSWARRYQLAAKTAASSTDRQIVVMLNSVSRTGPKSVERLAFRAEAERRRATAPTRLAA